MLLNHCLAFLKHGSLWLYRLATAAVIVAGVAFVVLVLGLRYFVLPQIDSQRPRIESAISRAAGQPVRIASVRANWHGYRPELHLAGVTVLDHEGRPALQLERVDATLSWVSLFFAEVRLDSLVLQGPQLEIRRDANGIVHVAGIALGRGGNGGGGFGDWLLSQRQILVRGAAIVWRDEMHNAPELRLDRVDFRLDNDGDDHAFGLSGAPPADVASTLVIRGALSGRDLRDLPRWTGRIYAQLGEVNLPLVQTWVQSPLAVTSGTGSLRLWLDLSGQRLARATADLSLTDVRGRLSPELPELALARLHGRLGWSDDGSRQELLAKSLTFTTADGLNLPLTQFRLALTGPAGSQRLVELQVEQLELAPVVQLAEFLPMEPALRERLKNSAPAGVISRGEFAWYGAFDPARPYRVRASFAGLALEPDGRLPGVRGLHGQVDATERGGTAVLGITSGSLEFPRLFAEPIPMEVLSAAVGWMMREGRANVAIRNVTFTNEHGAGSVQGSYQQQATGPGIIDLSGSLIRADARHVWRYIPNTAAGTRDWLRRALVAGESRAVRVRLKGRLSEFPFDDPARGVFEVVARVNGVTLEYAPGWPPIRDFSGEVAFRGRRMDVDTQGASLLGMQLADVKASIPAMGKGDEHLLVKGTVSAPSAELLRFVASSPVADHIDRFTENIRAEGQARLALEIDLPLRRAAQARASGEVTVADNRVVIDPRLPALEAFAARITFVRDAQNKGSVNVRGGHAMIAGTPMRFEADNLADGGVALKLGGRLDARTLMTLVETEPLRQLDGSFAWTGEVILRNKAAALRFQSDLVGIESRLPAPLGKAAADRLPLLVELQERPGQAGTLGVELGNLIAARFAIDTAARDLRRGMVSFGMPATLPGEDGLWIRGRLDRVDADAWNELVKGKGNPAGADIAAIDLRVGVLEVARRRFHDLHIDVKGGRGLWQGTLSGKEVAGKVSWDSQGEGRLVARLDRLKLPAPDSEVAPPPMAGDSLPSLDVIAESFVLDDRELGRLNLLADPDARGWRLRQLNIENPDAHLAVSGRWSTEGTPRTDVDVKLQVSDIGAFFRRMKYPEGIAGGTATLEGPVGWQGNPTRLDIRSLTGRLKLEARNGRFNQVSPGAAKLLGVVSLQALPKRLAFDFDDIFRKGFTFDRIDANVEIAAGTARTSDFTMEGSAAKVSMTGTVDLGAETQNLILRVTPSLSESIAVAGAIVNPAVGVAALIAQKALKDPFSSFAAFEYSLTGTWAEPVVTRLQKGTDNGAPGRK